MAPAMPARRELKSMTVHDANRISVEADGVTRVTRIGSEPIRLENARGFERVADQVRVCQRMREGKRAYSVNAVDGGQELHVFSDKAFTVVVGKP